MGMSDLVRLSAGDASLDLAPLGAEPTRWQVGGRDLLWSGDPEHWGFRAPILFPVVGASAGGALTVGGLRYPMPQHGFARRAHFEVIADSASAARLRLTDGEGTRGSYPFPFVLDVTCKLDPAAFSLAFEVTNTGETPMPYALGFHPAFLWPFDAPDRSGHRVVFDAPESDLVPEVAPGGLLARRTRAIPLAGRELPLDPDLFSEALVFLDARSRGFSLVSPTGGAIRMETDGFPHLAVWTRPTAPFLSLECWTGHADWEDAAGELVERASMRVLAPGESGRHAVTVSALGAPAAA
jgi:galactose mutarotase-like enzyme